MKWFTTFVIVASVLIGQLGYARTCPPVAYW